MKRILLIDDSLEILDSLSLVLDERYAVSAVSSAEEALLLTEQERFDAVLVDLMMPILDGAGFIRLLRERRDDTPVVLMSAAVDLAERGHALGVPTLAKPFEPDRLVGALETALTRRSPARPRLARPDGDLEESAVIS